MARPESCLRVMLSFDNFGVRIMWVGYFDLFSINFNDDCLDDESDSVIRCRHPSYQTIHAFLMKFVLFPLRPTCKCEDVGWRVVFQQDILRLLTATHHCIEMMVILRRRYAWPLLIQFCFIVFMMISIYTMTSICPSGLTADEDEIVDSDSPLSFYF